MYQNFEYKVKIKEILKMTPTSKINANGVEIGIIGNITDESAYISLTDIARYKNSEDAAGVISN